MASDRSFRVRPLTVLLVVVAIGLVVIGVVYLTTTAEKLPSVFPGHAAHVTRRHVKHGLAMFALAAVALVGAWFTTSPSQPGS